MNKLIVFLLIFLTVSCLALVSMKAILWSLFNWGGLIAIPVALIFLTTYMGSFFALVAKRPEEFYKKYISYTALRWIWIIGFLEILGLGVLYHLVPQYFPAVMADFFFY